MATREDVERFVGRIPDAATQWSLLKTDQRGRGGEPLYFPADANGARSTRAALAELAPTIEFIRETFGHGDYRVQWFSCDADGKQRGHGRGVPFRVEAEAPSPPVISGGGGAAGPAPRTLEAMVMPLMQALMSSNDAAARVEVARIEAAKEEARLKHERDADRERRADEAKERERARTHDLELERTRHELQLERQRRDEEAREERDRKRRDERRRDDLRFAKQIASLEEKIDELGADLDAEDDEPEAKAEPSMGEQLVKLGGEVIPLLAKAVNGDEGRK